MKLIILLGVFIFTFLPVAAQTAAVAPDTTSAAETELRRQAFDKVWNTINDKHYDPTFGGVNWAKMKETYAPKAAAAVSRADFHAVLRQMLGELKLSHFGIYPRDARTLADQRSNGSIGIELKILGGQPVITRVEPGSTAAAAGVRPGYLVSSVDGKTTTELLAPLTASLAGRSLTAGIQKVYRERTLLAIINGKAATAVKLGILDEKGTVREIEIERGSFNGEMSLALGNFPPQEVIFESRKLPGGIGYIRFNIWVIPQAEKLRRAISEFAGASGLIIDLRGNPGGVGGMAPGLAGMLVKEQISLGSMTSRSSQQKFIAYPQANAFLGKVVIIEDYGSASTSEVFAAGMQEAGRAAVVGETSAGAVLPSIFDTLPTDVIFQYAISDYRSPKNLLIEGRGVKPDVAVEQTRDALLNGHDLQLEGAVSLILK